MKKLKLLFCLLFLLALPAFAQEIPKTVCGVEPQYVVTVLGHTEAPIWRPAGITAFWEDASGNLWEFSANWEYSHDEMRFNGLKRMLLTSREERYEFPYVDSGERVPGKPFKGETKWKRFAETAATNIVYLSGDLWVEAVPYECSSVVYDSRGGEVSSYILLFKQGERISAVQKYEWIGDVPKKGEKFYLGRSTTFRSYFSVLKAGERFGLEVNVAESLKHLEVQRAAKLAEATQK